MLLKDLINKLLLGTKFRIEIFDKKYNITLWSKTITLLTFYIEDDFIVKYLNYKVVAITNVDDFILIIVQ